MKKSTFRDVPNMGVVWAVKEAMKLGFSNESKEWCNLGQGQPETGAIKGAPQRIDSFNIGSVNQGYGNLNGTDGLRTAVANHYNRLYRKNKKSKYSKDNVSICMGGRAALSRVFSAFNTINLGYKTPDYTAYENLIQYHSDRVNGVYIHTSKESKYNIPCNDLEKVIIDNNLDALIISNPCNPTGYVIHGKELQSYVEICSLQKCTLVFDEFYSHFIYENNIPSQASISSASYVEQVNESPVIIIDGLTKSFRYPGWRLGWVLGPKHMIEELGKIAGTIDGGPSQVVQVAGEKALESNYADLETTAVRNVFSTKRKLMTDSLSRMGVQFDEGKRGTFYIWGNIKGLPEGINNSDSFFRSALKEKVLTIPGHFFDINPGGERNTNGTFNQHIRFSFGPNEHTIKTGLDRLEKLIKSY